MPRGFATGNTVRARRAGRAGTSESPAAAKGRDVTAGCTVEMGDRSFCGLDVLADAPVSVCIKHAAKLMEFVSDRLAEQGGVAHMLSDES